MSLNVNRVTIAGHLTRDPEARQAGSHMVVQFGLAINKRFKGADGAVKEDTTFIDVEAWGKQAEYVAQYMVKGHAAYIEGRLKLETWEDKKTNQKRSRLKVVAEIVQQLREHTATVATPSSADDAPPPVARPANVPRSTNSNVDDEPPF